MGEVSSTFTVTGSRKVDFSHHALRRDDHPVSQTLRDRRMIRIESESQVVPSGVQKTLLICISVMSDKITASEIIFTSLSIAAVKLTRDVDDSLATSSRIELVTDEL